MPETLVQNLAPSSLRNQSFTKDYELVDDPFYIADHYLWQRNRCCRRCELGLMNRGNDLGKLLDNRNRSHKLSKPKQ